MIANDTFFYNYQAGNAIFGTNNLERMRITSGGFVGIGTTTPSEKLSVVNNVTIGLNTGIVKNIDEEGVYVGANTRIL